MHDTSEHERHQIESLLLTRTRRLESGVGLALLRQAPLSQLVYEAAVDPALRRNGLNEVAAVRVFGSEAHLSEVCQWVQTAEVIVADVTGLNADLMYVLGLCHGLRRCPLLIVQEPAEFPFNLGALRSFHYMPDKAGLHELREQLTRGVRTFLAAARGTSENN